MSNDRNGTLLKVGDLVSVPCTVKSIGPSDEYCNVMLETVEPMRPSPTLTSISLNCGQVELVESGAASRQMPGFSNKLAAAAAVLLMACTLLFSGCMTSKTQTVTGTAATGFTTNTVTTVNQVNLDIDAAVLQSVVATATALIVERDPSAVQPIRTAQRALQDICNGISQQSVQDVLGKLKAQGNPVVAQQVESLLKAASAIEQRLIMKMGSSVAGEISIALVKAADAGLIVGLGGR